MLKLFNESRVQNNIIIDKTLYEVCKANKWISDSKLYEFANLLINMGTNYFEVSSYVFFKIKELPSKWFILSIENKKDIDICLKSGIKRCKVRLDSIIDINELTKLKKNNVFIYVEVRADNKKEAEAALKHIEEMGQGYIDAVRFTGILNYESSSWKAIVDKCHRLKLMVDLCPDDLYHMAASIAFDGASDGANSITTSFCGFGVDFDYAPMEEIIISNMVLKESETYYDLSSLPEMVSLFCDLTDDVIADNKPVLGSSIFTVESGIHTHGLGKCSMTYEPYEPEMVGLKRQIKIGKHSGRKSIENRLEELGIDSSKYAMTIVLEAVREKSIQLKRDLYDEDLKALL